VMRDLLFGLMLVFFFILFSSFFFLCCCVVSSVIKLLLYNCYPVSVQAVSVLSCEMLSVVVCEGKKDSDFYVSFIY